MCSSSGPDVCARARRPSPRRCRTVAAWLAALALATSPGPSRADTPTVDIARLSATGPLEPVEVSYLFHGYSVLGLRASAAGFLERMSAAGAIEPGLASSLFDELAAGASRREPPDTVIGICETALRSGSATPLVLYAYGTALRDSGRLSEGADVLARIGPGSAIHPFALYALGQAAAEKGDAEGALKLFDRVRQAASLLPGGEFLEARARRSGAELLLATGRRREAAALFGELLRTGDDPVLRDGLAAASAGDGRPQEDPDPAEGAAGSFPTRIRREIARAGIDLERGSYDAAAERLSRADARIGEFLAATAPPPAAAGAGEAPDALARRLAYHGAIRRELASVPAGAGAPAVRAGLTELMADLLYLDHAAFRTSAHAERNPGAILDRVEEAALDGETADRLVERFSSRLDLLQNLAHPIQRYRLLGSMEKNRDELVRIRARIRESMDAAAADSGDRGEPGAAALLADVGRALNALDAIRAAAAALDQVLGAQFDIFRKGTEQSEPAGGPPRHVAELLRFDAERVEAVAAALRAEEDRAQRTSWAREKRDAEGLRRHVHRQLAQALAGQALARKGERAGWPPDAWALVERSASFVSGDRLFPADRVDCAVALASLLTREAGRWSEFPGRPPGEREAALAGALLPVLRSGAESGTRREDALYLAALLELWTGRPGAASTARRFLDAFPSSPRAADVAVRLGNMAARSGNAGAATELFARAAAGSRSDAAFAARYNLAQARLRNGNADGALRELAPFLSDPAFACGNTSSFEDAVLAAAVRAWLEMPREMLTLYPPVRSATCSGKRLLAALGEAAEKRGDWSRGAAAYEALADAFRQDESAPGWEMRAIENLIRAGKADAAYAKALGLAAAYGPGSGWSETRGPAARENARRDIAGILASLSERKLAAAIRSDDGPGMSLAADLMGELAIVLPAEPFEPRADLMLKRSAALLRAGRTREGRLLLEELLGEQDQGTAGEAAATLHAGTMIAGLSQGDAEADDVEDSARHLLAAFPSQKAAELGLRAAEALLRAERHAAAARVAESVERNLFAGKELVDAARLVFSEAVLYLDGFTAARAKADEVLGDATGDRKPEVRERATNLLLLASLREVERLASAKDHGAAAKILEQLADRFPGAPEAPSHLFRAARYHWLGGDRDGALRTGRAFLKKAPNAPDAAEAGDIVGRVLEERKEFLEAADLYAALAGRFPGNAQAQRFLFRSATLAADHGAPDRAVKRFSGYAGKYPEPRWMAAYAALSTGLLDWGDGRNAGALRAVEQGLHALERGVEPEAPPALRELGGKGRIAVGEHWAGRFRQAKLSAPMDKSIAAKDRLFRKALESFEKAETDAPFEIALQASQRSGDLLMEFGSAILDSARPARMTQEESAWYEKALRERARTFFETAHRWYVEALRRVESRGAAAELADPIRQRVAAARQRLAGLAAPPAGQEP